MISAAVLAGTIVWTVLFVLAIVFSIYNWKREATDYMDSPNFLAVFSVLFAAGCAFGSLYCIAILLGIPR